MTIGRPVSKDDINNTAAALSGQLFAVSDDILKFKAVLDAYTSANLVTAFGFVQADADNLKSAIADMAEVAEVFQGTIAGTQRDRRVFARQLLGTGVY